MHPSIPASSPSASTSGIEVTLSWTDGRLDSRRIYRFAGTLSALAIVARPGAEPELINVDRLAYVAFPRSPVQAGRAAVAPAGSVQVRVHVDPGKQFLVWALPGDLRRDTTGFFGTPVGLSPFDRIFFYSHAVDLIENDALLGDMLVEDGKVAPEALAAAVAAQNPRIGQLLVDQKRISSHALESALELQRRKRIPLGDVLLQEGLIQPGDLEEALAAQKASRNRRLGDVLVQQGFIDERSLAHTLGRKFHLPVVDLAEVSIDPESLNGIPADAMRRHQFLPLRQDERNVVVAVADPLNSDITDVLRFRLPGRRVQEVLATPTQLRELIERVLSVTPVVSSDIEGVLQEAAQVGRLDSAAVEVESTDDESVVARLVDQILLDAQRRGASDIHLEPGDQATVVRFRVGGACESYKEIPGAVREAVVARIKRLAALDPSESKVPQEGGYSFTKSEESVDVRVVTIPTRLGHEDVVLRLIPATRLLSLGEMGLSARDQRELAAVCARGEGLFVVAGPHGSGRATTVHSLLATIPAGSRKIWAVEESVRITQPGVRQVVVQARAGHDYASTVPLLLRADPDVLLIGEMRDRETIRVVVEASLSGPAVFTSMHAGSASEAICRLLGSGVETFRVGDALQAVLAQRVGRRLCSACREPVMPTAKEREEAVAACGGSVRFAELTGRAPAELRLWRSSGCAACGGTGFAGRVVLHELLVVDDAIRGAIQRRASMLEMRSLAAAAGTTSLLEDAWAKVVAGELDSRSVAGMKLR